MRKWLIYSAVLFLFCEVTNTQGQSQVFAYGKGRMAKYQPKAVTGYKWETTAKVYEQLIDAKANWGMAAPELVMNNGKTLIAWMDPDKLEIGIEEKAYDVCVSFGADSLNALATLLAHEITHYYEKHDWVRQFASTNDRLSTSDSLYAKQNILEQETQADHLGGLLAFAAGYNTIGISATFLERAYAAYGYEAHLPGYPPLTDRIAIAENTRKELTELQGVWQTANLLNIIEEYETARSYYQHILKEYPSFEIFNNAGVNNVTAALKLFDPGDWPYGFPLELDAHSRLDQLKVRLPDDKAKRRQRLLAEALRYFQSASQIAKDYPPALINLACVYTLQEEWEDAEELALRARRKSKKQRLTKAQADAEIILGIIMAMQAEQEEATEWFEKAKTGNTRLAELNLAVLQKKAPAEELEAQNSRGQERISGLDLEDFLAEPDIDIPIDLGKDVYLGLSQQEDAALYYHYAEVSLAVEYVLFHRTLRTYKGKTIRGIGLGDKLNSLQSAYGKPTSTLELPSGTVLHYGLQSLFFELDQDDKVKSWTVYRKGTY